MPSYTITWEITVEGGEPLDAVLEAEQSMGEQAGSGKHGTGGAMFHWLERDTGKAGTLDLGALRLENHRQRIRLFRESWND